jgi:hypothetical protein
MVEYILYILIIIYSANIKNEKSVLMFIYIVVYRKEYYINVFSNLIYLLIKCVNIN